MIFFLLSQRSDCWKEWLAHRGGRWWAKSQLQPSSSKVPAGDSGAGQGWWKSGEVQADPAGARSNDGRLVCVYSLAVEEEDSWITLVPSLTAALYFNTIHLQQQFVMHKPAHTHTHTLPTDLLVSASLTQQPVLWQLISVQLWLPHCCNSAPPHLQLSSIEFCKKGYNETMEKQQREGRWLYLRREAVCWIPKLSLNTSLGQDVFLVLLNVRYCILRCLLILQHWCNGQPLITDQISDI